MLVNVKVLSNNSEAPVRTGHQFDVEVEARTSVDQLKESIEEKLNLARGSVEQKLVSKGKTLLNNTKLQNYDLLREGAKLHLILLKKNQDNLEEVVLNVVKKHFSSEDEAKRVVERFKRSFEAKILSLNLDDLERLAKHLDKNKQICF